MKLIIVMSLLLNSVCFANRESGGRIGASAVYVDFRSSGVGIDYDSVKTYQILYKAASARNEVVDEVNEPYGREGEVRYCLELSDASQRYNFIKSLAFSILNDAHVTGHQRTAVYVGIGCHNFEGATEQDLSKY